MNKNEEGNEELRIRTDRIFVPDRVNLLVTFDWVLIEIDK